MDGGGSRDGSDSGSAVMHQVLIHADILLPPPRALPIIFHPNPPSFAFHPKTLKRKVHVLVAPLVSRVLDDIF